MTGDREILSTTVLNTFVYCCVFVRTTVFLVLGKCLFCLFINNVSLKCFTSLIKIFLANFYKAWIFQMYYLLRKSQKHTQKANSINYDEQIYILNCWARIIILPTYVSKVVAVGNVNTFYITNCKQNNSKFLSLFKFCCKHSSFYQGN